MTTSDYILNSLFVLVVLRQARERRIDLRSMLISLAIVGVVAHQYVHTLPTAGNDLAFIVALALLGLSLGLGAGFATHVSAGTDGLAVSRVGLLAGVLLVGGISSRMIFAFAVSHGAEPAVRSFSIAHDIGATAWPVALVAMALCEVTARLVTVQLRGRRVAASKLVAARSIV